MQITRLSRSFLALAFLLSCAGAPCALAQLTNPDLKPAPSKYKPKKEDSNAPTAAPENTAETKVFGEVPLGPYITRDQARDILLDVRIVVYSDNAGMTETVTDPKGKSAQMPVVTPFKFDSMRILFPILRRTASSDLLGTVQPWEDLAGGKLGYRGRLMFAERLVDFEPELLDANSQTSYAAWDFKPAQNEEAREVEIKVQYPIRCYATLFDEKAAMNVKWPANWPREAQDAMQPQLYIEQGLNDAGEIADYKKDNITKAVKLFLADQGIKDPKDVPPVRVAKALAGGVWNAVNPTGDGIAKRKRTSEMMGLTIQAPTSTLEQGTGSPHDMVALLVALLREAGIPARPVIGVDIGGRDDKFLSKGSDKRKLHSWVEFYLYDEANKTHNWIPIDIIKMRKSTTRPPKIDQPWRGFGTCPDMEAAAPFAVSYQPPQKGIAAYGAAGFWGWFVTPETPKHAEQVMTFSAGGVPNRGGDDLTPATGEPKKDKKSGSKMGR
ncbi:MAG: transglutaminase-like domain-containing protein [Phycisphaerales bacterium]